MSFASDFKNFIFSSADVWSRPNCFLSSADGVEEARSLSVDVTSWDKDLSREGMSSVWVYNKLVIKVKNGVVSPYSIINFLLGRITQSD